MFKLRIFNKVAAVLRLADEKRSISLEEDFIGNLNPGTTKKIKPESTEHFPAAARELAKATFSDALSSNRIRPILVEALNQYFLLKSPEAFLRTLRPKLEKRPDPKLEAILQKWTDHPKGDQAEHFKYRFNVEKALFSQLDRLKNAKFKDEETQEMVLENIRMLKENMKSGVTFKAYRSSKNPKLKNIVGKLLNQFILAFPNRSKQLIESQTGLSEADLDTLANYLAGFALRGIEGNYRNKLISDTVKKFDNSLRGILGSPGRMKALGSYKSGEDIVNDALQDISAALVAESYRLVGIRKGDASLGELPALPNLGSSTSLVQHIDFIIKNRMKGAIQTLKKENVHDEKEAKRKLLDFMENKWKGEFLHLYEAEDLFASDKDAQKRLIPALIRRYFPGSEALNVEDARHMYETDASTYSRRVLDPSRDILHETDAYRTDERHKWWEERVPAAISGVEKLLELEKVGKDFNTLFREMEKLTQAGAKTPEKRNVFNEVQELKAVLDALAAKFGDKAIFREAYTHYRALTKLWRSQTQKGQDVRETGITVKQVFQFLKSTEGLYGPISDVYGTMNSRLKEGKLAEFIAEAVGGREEALFESKLFAEDLPVWIQNYQSKKEKLLSETGLKGTPAHQEIQREIIGPALDPLIETVQKQVKNVRGQEVADEEVAEANPEKAQSPKPRGRKPKSPVKTSSRQREGSLWIQKLYRDFLRGL